MTTKSDSSSHRERVGGGLGSPTSWLSRRGVLRAVIVPVLAAVAAFDAFFIEPSWPKLVKQDATLAGLTSPVRIAVLADLHTKETGSLERRVLAIVEREKPDLILLPGDLAHNRGTPHDAAAFVAKLSAPLGVWVVPGNWDYWRGGRDAGAAVYRAAGVAFLRNETARVRDDLVLVGLDDTLGGHPDPTRVLATATSGARLVLMHEPGLFDRVAGHAPLAIAGHTHGGQGRLPLWGPITLPPGSGPYEDGWYELAGSHMYVSRGIGTSVVRARFLCRPEVTLLTLSPES